MLSIQPSAPVLPRVIKLFHHSRRRRRQHRSFQNHLRRRSSKTKNQPSITIRSRIRPLLKVHPKNDDKVLGY
ncbi:unnamed protein product [Rotaria sordida]|uniref:Uncharacterized protein n=1 Tax=Rotaria sordida TaxID=392033 RepID=A0A815Z237_9BILA|nr:unnamed protein product [Rotaria sordida]CAF1516688.1 unnamed protein product [Rotaria sordida]CAF1578992.1 unnamed protein product [Rotaria sordida]CAF3762749.1 unnamed protein product [Rotaria sordida]CAF4144140.1 unnamed protein product [Rotaria sordida]